jgi:REP element-mobilizing transposase RayT
MPQSFAALQCHVVFSTKHREAWLKTEVRPRLFEYVGGILRNQSSPLLAAGGMPDHIHLLVSLSRTAAIADIVRVVKSNSSAWLQQTIGLQGFHWQDGYAAFSVSHSNIEQVRAYLANQEQHHRGQSFQDELRELLRRHQIEWDERYAWD